ncbi:uncharacterized protein EI90DRAFT_3067848 [Cantharellus anzutake]|uniref:uncharacterized protein n=1 Tax=Cantharellus anzutake TaxID=1750568 RepID=UPI0019042D51|nr:uncharacterized protein EI90DRAFT_3067848 [Cantharellus anzutake]KAF8327452.1 hypothetical protein EI90DRAFT_3067848 [Cantharellus anzutake]
MTINTLRALALSLLFVLHVSACDVLFPAFQSIYDEVPFTVYWDRNCTGPFALQLRDRDLNVLQYSYTGNDTSVQLELHNFTGTTIYFSFRDDYGIHLTSPDYIVLPGSSNGTHFSLSVQSEQSERSSLSEALTSSLISESPAFSISFQSVSTFTSAPSLTSTITSIRPQDSNPTTRKSTNAGATIGGAAGGAVIFVFLLLLLLYWLRSRMSGGQKDTNIGDPVAPVPLGKPISSAGTSTVGSNVHKLAYSSPGSMPSHHTLHSNRRHSGHDNLLAGAAIPGSASLRISPNVVPGPPRVVNPGIRDVALGWEPGEGPTVQMSIVRSVPHPAPDDAQE